MLPKKNKFIVKCDALNDFLGILDPGESALVTYRGYPHDDYIVELEFGTHDPDIILCGDGVTAID